jgi:hypothetical protein
MCRLIVSQTPSPGKTPSGLGEAIQAVKAAGAAVAQNLEITTRGEDAQMGELGCDPLGRGGFWRHEFSEGEFSREVKTRLSLNQLEQRGKISDKRVAILEEKLTRSLSGRFQCRI